MGAIQKSKDHLQVFMKTARLGSVGEFVKKFVGKIL